MKWRLGVVLLVLCLSNRAHSALAQDLKDWVGKRVVQRRPDFVLRDGAEVIDLNGRVNVYRVYESRGPWVAVTGSTAKQFNGWTAPADLVPIDQAVDYFTKFIADHPKGAFGYTMRGVAWRFERHDDAKATLDFDRAIDLSPGEAAAYCFRGMIRANEAADYEKSQADFDMAIRLDPGDPRSWALRGHYRIQRGVADHLAGELEQGMADLDKAIALDPDFGGVYLIRAGGWQFKKEYDRALADCAEAMRRGCARLSIAFTTRANIRFAMGEYDNALADYNEALMLDPLDSAARAGRAKLWTTLGATELAKADRAESPAAKVATLQFERGEIEARLGKFAEAIADFDKAIRFDPNNPEYLTGRGNAWFEKGDFDRSLADLNRALSIDPACLSALIHRAEVLHAQEQDDNALIDVDRAIELDPANARVFLTRALILRSRKPDAAIDDLTAAIKLDASDPVARVLRGKMWEDRREWNKALDDYTAAIKLGPLKPEHHRRRAALLASCPDKSIRDPAAAVESAKRACELSQWNDAACLDTLAKAFAELGNFDAAVEWATRAIEQAKDDKLKRLYQQRLEGYKKGELGAE